MEPGKILNNPRNPEQNDKARGATLPDLKIYHKALATRRAWS